MFQTFASQSSPEQGPPRLAALRDQMTAAKMDGFLIPRADAFQGEYVAPCDARLGWLTGFTGSAGFCAALHDIAGVFIDGRYRVQVRQQIAGDFTPVHWPETQLGPWLREQLPQGGKVGFDPWLHSVDEIKALRKSLHGSDITLVSYDNLVDAIWDDRPARPDAPFTEHPMSFAGEAHVEKRQRLGKALAAACTVITLPDSIAWLLNIRGTDIERNPVPQAFATLDQSGAVTLYALEGKTDRLAEHLGPDITVKSEDQFPADLEQFTSDVQIDPKSCPLAVARLLTDSGVQVSHGPDPCLLAKAIKNKTEIDGAKAAHLRDGVAMVQFLAWLNAEAHKGQLTEIDVVKALEGFRVATNLLRDISFETISGAGPHGAIVHYRVTEESNRAVNTGELLLVDSGGQYSDGTTDITRTIAIGTPQDEHKTCYTRVLQGMIAISLVRFPKGLSGQHLDALARVPLWAAGQDYDHGTGHGVGSYLSVHEGPQGISRRATVPFQSGMIVSNEPGYYREGAFGIRIENLIVVVDAPELAGADARDMLAFDTLTYVPLDRSLIDTQILTQSERDWIDCYHADTLSLLAPQVDGAALGWLNAACAPL